jgi:hypothetical protein
LGRKAASKDVRSRFFFFSFFWRGILSLLVVCDIVLFF